MGISRKVIENRIKKDILNNFIGYGADEVAKNKAAHRMGMIYLSIFVPPHFVFNLISKYHPEIIHQSPEYVKAYSKYISALQGRSVDELVADKLWAFFVIYLKYKRHKKWRTANNKAKLKEKKKKDRLLAVDIAKSNKKPYI